MSDTFLLRQDTINLRNFHAVITDAPNNNFLLKPIAY